MKRSTQVLLTLMLPAVAAFGCDAAKKQPPVAKANCSGPAKPGEPPKTEFCDPATATNRTTYGPRISTGPGIFMSPGGTTAVAPSGNTVGQSPNSTNLTNPSGVSRPSGAPSSVTSGGFGRTGSSLSSSS
ncbi:MAG: hypothetical protein ACK5EO_01120 [Planctomycetota bacterium]|jgi:hypothetical protein